MMDEIRRITDEDATKFAKHSNDRLKTIALKKIDTTMIGALDIIEKEINQVALDLSDADSITLKDAYGRMRSKILDNGNNQKRSIQEEFKHYTVYWQGYTIKMPVKKREGQE